MSREKQIYIIEADIKTGMRAMEMSNPRVYRGLTYRPAATHLEAIGYRKQSENVIKLPIKVGDTVYVPWRWDFQQGVANVKVEEIKFYDSQMHYMFLIDMESDNECFNQSFGGWKTEQCIGKTVFLTREEAEAKMKGGE